MSLAARTWRGASARMRCGLPAGTRPPLRVRRGTFPLVALLVLATLAAVAGGCARVMAPPGWIPDHTPPQLVSTSPAQLAMVPDWKGPVVFHFDERISEKGVSDQTAIISPDTGLAEVSRHGSEIRVRPRDGWQAGRLYHVVLLPTVSDLFGNKRTAPVELVFSTGPAIPTTAVAGLVTDRLTGHSAGGALVQAIHLPDSLTYTTASDTSGFFALRYIPEGRYVVRAFNDGNHDRKLDFREPQGSSPADVTAKGDTIVIPNIALLPGDTTPARLLRAEAGDSLSLHLTLDDYVDPTAASLSGAGVQLWRLPDSVLVPAGRLMFKKQVDSLRAQQAAASAAARARAVADSSAAARTRAAPDTSAAAHTRAAPDTSAAARTHAAPDSAAARARAEADSAVARARAAADSAAAHARAVAADTARPLPAQDLFLILSQPLAPLTRYRVTVHGITNINGIHGGGGTATFQTPAPAKPPVPVKAAAPADSTRPATHPDTTAAATPPTPADSARSASPGTPDSTRVLPRAAGGAAPHDTTHH